ncbi:S-adenosylmethionine synthetase [Parafrankia irregularis]|uniref:S-adenosylmethionine synthetase n=1 Tax=Parafrankia irregularis TaxID=795642 RepID=A0A0S4R219_9ACTN|nr:MULTISPECIES: methionine adenosyltransferase [Parafrankia]MBE3206633.1 methionine adenosyltransferase [Parafrankia sp. CH37]MBE3206742.1 methionine adenosyltransferase [Parafrankia sp. CH37]CUU61218.1 S-adenosylmethionine synthetase [Parafrankia irregularis]
MDVITTAGLYPVAAESAVEVIERKGSGHPDTLADGMAEAISRAYSAYCLDHFGAILHHNTDKLALLGGGAEVTFGHGEITAPIQVLVNGRITAALGEESLPVEDIVTTAARDFLGAALPLLDTERWVRVRPRLTQASSPGAVTGGGNADREASRQRWFAPRSLDDLAERHRLFSNDTSAGVGYFPLGIGEQLASGIETHLSSEGFRAEHPYFGTDIKLMVVRTGASVRLTACVPQIARHTPDLDTYIDRRALARELIAATATRIAPGVDVEVFVNTRDQDSRPELYLTATGSSIESGDEGVVGRGNRSNGLISMFRPWSAEGVSGKNPVYHVGKLYNLAATEAARRLHEETGLECAVALVSQSGRDLADPWQAIVQTSGPNPVFVSDARRVLTSVMADLDGLRERLLTGKLATA